MGRYDFPERNRLARRSIEATATSQGWKNAAIGLVGFAPLPGAGAAAIATSIACYSPIYESLARDLGAIYEASHEDVIRGEIVAERLPLAAAGRIDKLAPEFGKGFMTAITPDALIEVTPLIAASFVPAIGAAAAVSLGHSLAATITWRIGTMISIYFQNDRAWIGDRLNVYRIAAKLTGGLSSKIENRVDLNAIREKVSPINETHIGNLLRFVTSLVAEVESKGFEMDDADILASLFDESVPRDLAEAVLKRYLKSKGETGH